MAVSTRAAVVVEVVVAGVVFAPPLFRLRAVVVEVAVAGVEEEVASVEEDEVAELEKEAGET